MKQRPIFILLTFFIAIISVVLITFVFLRTQLSEQKLQKMVTETLVKNFPQFNVELDNIGLSLGTKFRYKINKIEINLKDEEGVFKNVILKNVSIKFPLFFLIGKQDIDVSVEQVAIDGFDYDYLSRNNFKITSLQVSQLQIPKFLVENRVNVTFNGIKFNNQKSKSILPFNFNLIDHLVMKDVSFEGKTAMELAGIIEYYNKDNMELSSNFRVVALGHFNLGQLFASRNSEYKLLVEVKEAANPTWGWLNNHRIQIQKQFDQLKTNFQIYGNALEGTGNLLFDSKTVTFDDLNIDIKPAEVARESSILKSLLHLVGKTLAVENMSALDANVKGVFSFIKTGDSHSKEVVDNNNNNYFVLSHINSSWSKEQTKVDITVDSEGQHQIIVFKKGSDLSYRVVKLDCTGFYCIGDSLKSIEVNFYNQILPEGDSINSSLFSLSSNIANSWGTMLHIVSAKKVTPLKIFWRKSRWSDFEFDLSAEATMNNKVLATESIKIHQRGNDLALVSMSLESSDDNDVSTRVLAKISRLPLAVLTKFMPSTPVDVSGLVTGNLAFESSKTSQKLSADLKCGDGHIQWQNLDDLYRRAMFKNPEEEMTNPQLAWKSQFNLAKLVLNWNEKNKDFQFDIVSPVASKRTLTFKIDESLKDFLLNIKYASLGVNSKKILTSHAHHLTNEFNFSFTQVGKELQLIPQQDNNDSP